MTLACRLKEYLSKHLREIGESVNRELSMGGCCERSFACVLIEVFKSGNDK